MGIATDIALILVAALVGGIIAQKLGQPLLIGYIIAGLAVGPYTGGPQVAEIHDIELLSEIGVALLLFALGLEFNLSKLAKVKWIALIGTPIQLAVTAGVGYGIARLTGWSNIAAIWAGCAMALSSTMVILKMLTAQGELGTLSSRIMISMLIVQDLAMVPMLLILPQLNDANANLLSVGTALLQAAMFLVLMFVVGTRVMPFVLRLISSWGSRELFLVAVMASGLGIGYATSAVGMSFAFGAFIAGMVLSESDYSHQALSDIIPLRDIFGTVFFVSVGMLIDPVFVWENAPTIAFFVAVVLVAKFVIFWLVSYLFNYKGEIPVHIGLGLFQIGEFSFVLARVARGDDAIDTPQYNLLLATALVTMVLTPSVLKLRPVLTRLSARLFPRPTVSTKRRTSTTPLKTTQCSSATGASGSTRHSCCAASICPSWSSNATSTVSTSCGSSRCRSSTAMRLAPRFCTPLTSTARGWCSSPSARRSTSKQSLPVRVNSRRRCTSSPARRSSVRSNHCTNWGSTRSSSPSSKPASK